MVTQYTQLLLFENVSGETDQSEISGDKASSSKTHKIECRSCELPAAEITNGTLMIRSRHHGKTHVTAISLDRLKKLIEGD